MSEHDKLKAVQDKSQACGEFLEWLTSDRGLSLTEKHVHGEFCFEVIDEDREEPTCHMTEGRHYPAIYRVAGLLAEFFEIDEKKLEQEKLAMLAELRG